MRPGEPVIEAVCAGCGAYVYRDPATDVAACRCEQTPHEWRSTARGPEVRFERAPSRRNKGEQELGTPMIFSLEPKPVLFDARGRALTSGFVPSPSGLGGTYYTASPEHDRERDRWERECRRTQRERDFIAARRARQPQRHVAAAIRPASRSRAPRRHGRTRARPAARGRDGPDQPPDPEKRRAGWRPAPEALPDRLLIARDAPVNTGRGRGIA